ncbi:MAG: hypothetical protein ACJ72X_17470 [Nitrososphaeraceae archaeon]
MAITQNDKREKEASIDIHASTAMRRNMHTYSCLKEKMTPNLSFWSAKPLLFGFTIFQ